MNKRMLSIITALTVAAGIFGIAAADTVPANMGRAAIGSQMGSFNLGTNGAVTATGFGGLRSWQIGLPLDIFGPKVVSVASRATIPGASWRVVTASAGGTAVMMSAPAPILVSPVFLPAVRTANVLPLGVCFILASMNSGSSIASVNYNM